MSTLLEPSSGKAGTRGFAAGLAGHGCRLETDTPRLEGELERWLGGHRMEQGACSGRIHASLTEDGLVSLRVEDRTGPVEAERVLDWPEWKALVPQPHPSRRFYTDTVLGTAPALELRGPEWIVQRREHWGNYLHLLWNWLLVREHPLVHLHAAVSAVGETALVLVGPSGAGKSTLSCALHLAGAEYHGDECAFYTLPELHLHVPGGDLRLRPGGVEMLGDAAPGGRWYESKPADPKCVVSMPAAPPSCPRDRVLLVFMDGFAPEPELRPAGGGDAARRLLRGISYGDPSMAARLEVAAALVNRYPCRRLKVGRPAETAALLIGHAGKAE